MAEVTIDEIREGKDGTIALVLRHEEPWDDEKAVSRFEQKLQGYIEVVRHGTLRLQFPQFTSRRFQVVLLCLHSPTPAAEVKLREAGATLRELGTDFRTVVIQVRPSAEYAG
jgi:hypothetical protein